MVRPRPHSRRTNLSHGGPSYCRSEEHTSELQSPISTLFPYTTLFRSGSARRCSVENPGEVGWYVLGRIPVAPTSVMVVHRTADRKSTRLNSSHRYLHSFPTRRSSDLGAHEGVVSKIPARLDGTS